MKDKFRKAVENKDEQELIKCLNFNNLDKLDSNCFEYLEKALKETCHSQHEDLVNTIYLENLRDDRLVEPILNIAIDREHFRWYDDELEATLRKCVHALKTINSDISNSAIEKLKELNNENVKYVLEMYK
ncbi:hypothetical protein ACTS9T_15715 [Empedobacter falsenii]|uniref:hypothetical protein n=1 Tax=Empedobacter TaxID=59734 RepID=UPI0005720509|nr:MULTISPECIES: hypothetical protein [Empedobacter]MDH1882778.1 hypothetical protein [Empedobacter sp. GD03797]MDM1043116.1 hypothetical protein [Empedobacter brevis]MDM1137037.1 hypothetical protein [Empedobacter sp. R750]